MLSPSQQTRPETPPQTTHKIAIVICSNITTEAMSRAYRALGFAAELMAAGDDVNIVFDGGGSATLAAVIDPARQYPRQGAGARSAGSGFSSRASSPLLQN